MTQFGPDLYVKLSQNLYVLDAVHYQPGDYTLFGEGEFPHDILNQCYQLINGEFVLDQDKYDQMYPEELDEFGNPINPDPMVP
jgi:hypothetical protein